jgi:D-amino peptidase
MEAGADEILVLDGHGPGGIDPELLHEEALLLAGKERAKDLGMDSSFDALFFVGQHAMNLTPEADLCHTYSSRGTYRMLLNGEEIGELGMRVVLAGRYGFPLALVTGDDKACAEALALVGDVETAAVKRSTSRQSAISLHPVKARELIREKARRAIERLGDFEPYLPPGPYEYVREYYDKTDRSPEDRSWDQPIGEVRTMLVDDFLDIVL